MMRLLSPLAAARQLLSLTPARRCTVQFSAASGILSTVRTLLPRASDLGAIPEPGRARPSSAFCPGGLPRFLFLRARFLRVCACGPP